jgi:hypothetical protein
MPGCSPMGRQPDDLGTPALAWLALPWWIPTRSILAAYDRIAAADAYRSPLHVAYLASAG